MAKTPGPRTPARAAARSRAAARPAAAEASRRGDAPRPVPPDTGGPAEGRGSRRREQLVGAGIELLGELGWAGVTARAVAERAGTHAGLLHYHFGGLPQFKREVAAAAVRQLAGPVLTLLTASPEWTSGLASVLRAAAEPRDSRTARVSAELITASLHDAEVAGLMRSSLAEARAELVGWLRRTGAAEPSGVAVLVLATLDGLLLHQLLDPELQLGDAAAAAASLAPAVQDQLPTAGAHRSRTTS